MNFICFRSKASTHRSKIDTLKDKAAKLGWNSHTIDRTMGLDYSHHELEYLGKTIGASLDRVGVLQDLRIEAKRELSALLSYSEQHY